MRSPVVRHWRKYITKVLRQIGEESVLVQKIILILQMRRGTITVKASRRKAEIIGTTWTESLPFGRPTNNTDLFTTKQTKKHPPVDGGCFLNGILPEKLSVR